MGNHTPLLERPMNGGTQALFRFDNGYGASLIRGGSMAYGGLEIAVVKFTGEGSKFELVYDTPITNDVLGHLSEADIEPVLNSIAALPKGGQ